MLASLGWLILFLAFGLLEGYAVANRTDKAEPLTHYIRAIRGIGPLGVLILWIVWAWLGCHFLLDVDGSLPC